MVTQFELAALVARRIQEINKGIEPPPAYTGPNATPEQIATYEVVSKKLDGYYLEKKEVRGGISQTILYPLQSLIFPRVIFASTPR
jgi:hypothetical protein